jgi:hypothetical protein
MDSDWKLNNKNIEDFIFFSTVIYFPHPINGSGVMTPAI